MRSLPQATHNPAPRAGLCVAKHLKFAILLHMNARWYTGAHTYIKILARAILWLLLVFVVISLIPSSSQYAEAPNRGEVASSTRAVVGPVLPEAIPVSIRIPRLALETTFSEMLGLLATGEIAVPQDYDTVGWYGYGPTPGELGPAVVLGHVDSVSGPAVFFSLGQLEAGDEIFIDRSDGTTATFVVTELERPAQQAFPTARVYGDIDHAGLRLITCSGTFIRGQQRYTHNLIVYARLAEPRSE